MTEFRSKGQYNSLAARQEKIYLSRVDSTCALEAVEMIPW